MTSWPEKITVNGNPKTFYARGLNEAHAECSKAAVEMLEGLKKESVLAYDTVIIKVSKINALIDEIRANENKRR